jgi:DUF438 domain-containing protein
MSKDVLSRVQAYINLSAHHQSTKQDYDLIKEDIEKLTPRECFLLIDDRRVHGESHEQILEYLERVLMAFYPHLKTFEIAPTPDSFIEHLSLENQAFSSHLESIKTLLKKKDFENHKNEMFELFKVCDAFNVHYLKKENILFPMLEKKSNEFKGLSLMWTLHDQTRLSLKKILEGFEQNTPFEKMSQLIGTYFFQTYGLIQKETYVLFPSATILSKNEDESMREQSFEYGFAFIPKPEYRKVSPLHSSDEKEIYTTKTGTLRFDQLKMFLDMLPLDCTIVDEHDKVIYFNNPKERFFPRSEAVLGRNVVDCHPGHSVNIVLDILNAFKENKEDSATFWINFKRKKLYIQYLAMRDDSGNYKGVIELTQDITNFIGLDGERRLLDWSN